MPYGDRTGPAGLGPMTGRAAGYCAGYGRPGYMNPAGGRGWGYGRGGHGYRHLYYATGLTGWQRAAYPFPVLGPFVPFRPGYDAAWSKEQELDALKRQAEYFQNALEEIRKQIDDLEAQQKKSD